MAPEVATLSKSLTFWDVCDGTIKYCGFAAFGDDDVAYIGRISNVLSRTVAREAVEAALNEIPDDHIYPEITCHFTKAPEHLVVETFVKRPSLHDYYFFRGEDGHGLSQLRDLLLDEARALEIISRSPHRNIVGYHGCRVKRGRITGIVLDKIDGPSLFRHLESGGSVDSGPFMEALTSAVESLHKLGLSHNDICPQNVMVSNGKPVLIDFGSCRKTGDRMGASGGSTGWKEEGDEYTFSKQSHDLAGLEKIQNWISEKSWNISSNS